MKKKRDYHMYEWDERLGTPITGHFGSNGKWVDGQLDILQKITKGEAQPRELYRYFRWHTFHCCVKGCDYVGFRIGGKQTRCPKHQKEHRDKYKRAYMREYMRKRRKGAC